MAKVQERKDGKGNPAKATLIGANADNMRELILEAVKCQRDMDKKSGNVSNSLLRVAVNYQPKGSIGHISLDETSAEGFIMACKMHEDYVKSLDAGRLQVDKLPRCWTQAKSNIKAAINYGMDLRKYNTESSLRKDVMKMRKAQAGTDPVKAALAAFKKEIDALPEDTALELMNQINQLAKEAIAELVPNKPIDLNAEVVVSNDDVESELIPLLKAG